MSSEHLLWKNETMQRRIKRAFASAVTLFALSSGFLHPDTVAAAPGEAGQADLVYVGTNDNRICALRFDAVTGNLSVMTLSVAVQKPRWTALHPTLPILYSVNDDGKAHGSVIAFAIDRQNGQLTRLNEVSAVGDGGTYLWLDAASMTLFSANYGAGSVSSLSINPDGSLGSLTSTIRSIGSGPNPRQAAPHAHSVALDPSGRYALVPDFGADRVFVYGFDRATRALLPDDAADPHAFVAPAGSGPRHLVFGKDGRYVYLLDELAADILTLRWDAQKGSLSLVRSLPISNAQFQGKKSASEIALGHDGRFLYAGDRGENSLAVYRIDADTGELTPVQRIASGGDVPWAFAIHPSGKWLLVANQGSGKVNVFGIDPASGRLNDSGKSVDLPVPLSITFVH